MNTWPSATASTSALGANLARVELEVVYGTLLRRIPGPKPAVTMDQLRFRDDAVVYGVHALTVAW
ncbi:hypothetical protein [Streptomyces cucumeris]|uniref:hypothetical protein n=1 Tax=Streptomyces cucumeris TaxID=2962890 RepID=UPI003D7395E3